jgi:predicted HTH domain antitoxin
MKPVEVDAAMREYAHMEDVLTIRLSSAILQMLNRSPEEMSRDMQLYAALMLFRLEKLSSGAAAELAGIPRVMFLDLCAEYGIPVSQITVEELRREIAS